MLVSAGYDAHELDLLGTFAVPDEGFARFVSVLDDLAARLCNGRLLLVLEGGYNVSAQAKSIARTLEVMMGEKVAAAA